MNSIVNHMGKYNHRRNVLSDWLTELEQRFQLGEVNTDKDKIICCQLLIGATGSSILAGLEDDATWETSQRDATSSLRRRFCSGRSLGIFKTAQKRLKRNN